MNLQTVNKKLTEFENTLKTKRDDVSKTKRKIDEALKSLEVLRESQAVVQAASKVTQEHLEIQLSGAVSALLHGVMDDPYNFKVEFVPKRNSMECNLLFERSDGKEIRTLDPLDGCGHGAADLASIGLKTSFAMLKENCRRTIIIDEPFRALSKDRHPLAAKVIKEISKELGIQFIIVTHGVDLSYEADKIFTVEKIGNKSIVKES